jgi:type IV secretory pathway TraG/TraD family ATPase VirD4
MVYQSDSQVQVAFRNKPALLYDNCKTKLYLSPDSLETAKRISEMLGSATEPLLSFGTNSSHSVSSSGQGSSTSSSSGSSTNYAVHGRPLMFPDEILRAGSALVFVFQGGFPAPILCRRLTYFADRYFNPNAPKPRRPRGWAHGRVAWACAIVVVIAFLAMIIHAKVNNYGAFAPKRPRYEATPQPKVIHPQPKGATWPKTQKTR